MDARLIAFERLLNIMDDLRENCPWDKKQTIDSLRYLTIEEVYELSDAIINNDLDEIKRNWVILCFIWCFMLRLLLRRRYLT